MIAPDANILRPAQPFDAEPIERFLVGHASTSMFLRSNLAAHGLACSDAERATSIFVSETAGNLQGVIGLTNSGYLLAQLPDCSAFDLSQARRHWSGRTVVGMTGVSQQVAWVLDSLGLGTNKCALDRNEPLYQLNLAALSDQFDTIRPPSSSDLSILNSWFTDYLIETGGAKDKKTARTDARSRAQRAVDTAGPRMLEVDGQPVAMTAFNAEVADMVQVGSVFVPRALRNRGYGRRVVAAHLAEARTRGINQAILFAASDSAARAYESIGFERIGTYRVVLFDPPATIQEVP